MITFTCTVESAPHPNLVDTDNDHFLKHQEQGMKSQMELKQYKNTSCLEVTCLFCVLDHWTLLNPKSGQFISPQISTKYLGEFYFKSR